MWPKTIQEIASDFGKESDAVLAELKRLDVPIYRFLDSSLVYPADLLEALKQHQSGPSRDQHMERILDWFSENGCLVERASLQGIRARGIFKVTSTSGDAEPIFIKMQVCNTLQRGQWVHFNLNTDILKQKMVAWVIMVAPVFAPGNTDFIGHLNHLRDQMRRLGYLDKPSFPFRLKETSVESYLENAAQELMEDIHGSYNMWQAAKQSLPERD